MEDIRVGLVGWSVHAQRYARHLEEVPGFRLAALCRQDARAGREEARRRGVRFAPRFEDLVEGGDLDAVILVGPTPLHAPMAVAALERGLWTLVEKPIADTLEGAEAISRAADGDRGRAMVAHTLRFEPVAAALRDAARRVGRVRRIAVDHRTPLVGTDGVLLGMGVHFFDLFASSGLARLEDARFEDGEIDEAVPDRWFRVRWASNGIEFDLANDRRDGVQRTEDLTVTGDEGEVVLRRLGGVSEWRPRAGAPVRWELERAPSLPPLLVAFRDFVRGERPPAVTISEATDALRWVLAVKRSLTS